MLNLALNPLSLEPLDERESIINIAVTLFPFDHHEQWLVSFARHTKLHIRSTESLADLSLASIEFKESVFILHISELTQNIWISNTQAGEDHKIQINQLFKYLHLCLD